MRYEEIKSIVKILPFDGGIKLTSKVKYECEMCGSIYTSQLRLLLKKKTPYCSSCTIKQRNASTKLSWGEFKELSQKAFQYTPVSEKWYAHNFKNTKTILTYSCPKCGSEVKRSVGNLFLYGINCKRCGNKGYAGFTLNRRKLDVGIDLSKITTPPNIILEGKTIKSTDTVKSVCSFHGEHIISYKSIKKNNFCPVCSKTELDEQSRISKDVILEKCDDYIRHQIESLPSEWWNNRGHQRTTSVPLQCEKHGNYSLTIEQVIRGQIYHQCSVTLSKGEDELREFINSLGIKTEKYRYKYEIDIFLPDYNIGFEYNGLYWHSEIHKHKNYHKEKYEHFKSKGIQVYHVWEDDWNNKKEIVKSMIRNRLGLISDKVYARKCIISYVDNKMANSFMDDNHIQGSRGATISLGLYYKNNLVSVMQFIKNGDIWELSRFASKLNVLVIGGFSKLLRYFEKTHNPNIIVSFSDNCYSNGGVYKKFFKLDKHLPPDYKYLYKNKLHHKFKFRKPTLKKMGGVGKTEHEWLNR